MLSRTEDLVFHPLSRMVGVNDRLSIQGWRVGAPKAQAGTATLGGQDSAVVDRLNRWGRLMYPLAVLVNCLSALFW